MSTLPDITLNPGQSVTITAPASATTPPPVTPPPVTPPPVTSSISPQFALFVSGQSLATAIATAKAWGVSLSGLLYYLPQPSYTSPGDLPSGAPPLTLGVGAVTPEEASAIGEALVKVGQTNPIIRPMWEFNEASGKPWFPDWGNDAASTFINIWNAAIPAFRAVAGLTPRMFWCSNGGPPDASPFYPGDATVDIIGLDQYNEDGWESNIDTMLSMAQAHGKQFGIGEIGINGNDSTGATYLTALAKIFNNPSNDVAVMGYFNYYNSALSASTPLSLAAIKAFAPASA